MRPLIEKDIAETERLLLQPDREAKEKSLER